MTTELPRVILGALILKPALIEAVDLRAGDFPAGQVRQTFEAISAIWEEARPTEIDPVLLAGRLGGDGASGFVSGCLDGNVKLAPDSFKDRVLELRRRNLTARIRDALRQQDALPELDLDEVRPLLDQLDVLRAAAGPSKEPASPLITFPELREKDIQVSWLVDGLLPENSVTILYGRTTVGKSWLALMMAEAVSAGLPIFSKATTPRPVVYIDLENPLAVMKDRADTLQMRSLNAQLWHSTMIPGPPKMDGPKWSAYKTILPPGALAIIDTSRTAHDGKENDSDVAALVMNRCRDLRDAGRTILILHHTPKANDRDIKASGAWADLADHTIQFYKVKGLGQTEEDEGAEILPGSLLCLATGKKTRYAPMPPIYMTLSPTGLILAEDPNEGDLNALAAYIAGEGLGKNQSQITAWAKDGLGIKKRDKVLSLLSRGEREHRWRTVVGFRGAKTYEPN